MEAAPDASRIFLDRSDAGRHLAARLEAHRTENPVVIGSHRGATPVAFEVARALDAPLEVLVVRELMVPGARGRVLGAVAEGNIKVIDPTFRPNAEQSVSGLSSEISRLSREVEQDALRYRHGRPPMNLTSRSVVLVAAGLTHALGMQAAIDAVRARGAHRVIAAIGVCSRPTAQEIRRSCDEVIVLRQPESFLSVGEWYREYPPLTDELVVSLLQTANAGFTTGGGSPSGT